MGGERVVHVDILCILFGIGTWLCVNGLWVELPLLVQRLPEGWSLPSYLAVIIQLANIGPLSYTILNSLFPAIITEKRSIYFVMIVGLVAVLLLPVYWEGVESVFGTLRSVNLLVLVFMLAFVDCSSRVMYLPFMARFKSQYLTSFFIGEGLSGFVPSIFALIQGSGGNPGCVDRTDGGNGTVPSIPEPLFSIEIFFYLLAFFTLISAVAFYVLNCPSIVGKGYAVAVHGNGKKNEEILLANPTNKYYHHDDPSSLGAEQHALCDAVRAPLSDVGVNSREGNGHEVSIAGSVELEISQPQFIYLMVLLTVVCALANGVFPSIQSYSSLPYGNAAYHWAVTLSSMANPGVCFLMFYVRSPTRPIVTAFAFLSFFVGAYILTTALMSPSPPLVESFWGKFILVISWINLVGLFTYVKVSIATMMRVTGKSGLFWTGAFTQLGSSVGAVAAFVAVNYAKVFQSYNPCD